ncbi:MAG: hypothetical protein J6Y94_03085 [Bacteriovoracaceae bacterium]|nr:hypothetical protein [Bacteriovoracaceae bacterium]
MNRPKLILILLAIFSSGLGFYGVWRLKPFTGEFPFWVQALQQNLSSITNFTPRSWPMGAPLIWTEQWEAAVDQLAPWVLAYQAPAPRHLGRLRFYQEDPARGEGRPQEKKGKMGAAYELKDIVSFSWHLEGTALPAEEASAGRGFLGAPFILVMTIAQKSHVPQTIRISLPNLNGMRDVDGRWVGDPKFAHLHDSGRTGAQEGLQTYASEVWQALQKFNQEQFDRLEMVSEENHLVLCQQVDDQCQVIGRSTCDQCRYGYFPVVGRKFCPHTGTYACGPNHCGEAYWPACWRGFVASGQEAIDYCVDGSLAGYCHAGLQAICRDGLLYCW